MKMINFKFTNLPTHEASLYVASARVVIFDSEKNIAHQIDGILESDHEAEFPLITGSYSFSVSAIDEAGEVRGVTFKGDFETTPETESVELAVPKDFAMIA